MSLRQEAFSAREVAKHATRKATLAVGITATGAALSVYAIVENWDMPSVLTAGGLTALGFVNSKKNMGDALQLNIEAARIAGAVRQEESQQILPRPVHE